MTINDLSPELQRHFTKLCIPKKPHQCRICGDRINVAEPCLRWAALNPGEGYGTSHAHPECFQLTLDHKWDEGDWENLGPGDIEERPARNRPKPSLEDLWDYLKLQFPATEGHIPLQKKLEAMDQARELARVNAGYWEKRFRDVRLKLRDEILKLRAELKELKEKTT